MTKKIIIALALTFLLANTQAFSREKMRIAVLDLQASGVSKKTAATVSNMLRTDLVNMGKFIVVERNQMKSVLKEQGFQQTGCTDQSCAVQIGRLISANKMLMGEVSPLGKSLIITVRIVDVEKGVVQYAAREKAKSEDMLDIAVTKITRKLSARIGYRRVVKRTEPEKKIEEEAPGKITPTGYYMRSIVPGWGQIYAGNTMKGGLILGGFLASGGFFGFSLWWYKSRKKLYDDLPAGSSTSEFDSKYNAYKGASIMAYTSFALLIAVYGYNWADVIFITSPDYTSTAVIPVLPINNQYGVIMNTCYADYENENAGEMKFILGMNYRF